MIIRQKKKKKKLFDVKNYNIIILITLKVRNISFIEYKMP